MLRSKAPHKTHNLCRSSQIVIGWDGLYLHEIIALDNFDSRIADVESYLRFLSHYDLVKLPTKSEDPSFRQCGLKHLTAIK